MGVLTDLFGMHIRAAVFWKLPAGGLSRLRAQEQSLPYPKLTWKLIEGPI